MGEPLYRVALQPNTLTELRIHGVSGPDPASVLESASAFHVAGDELTGFARRRDDGPYGPTDTLDGRGRRLEAFSWKGVSSGASSRALWLLLGPFAVLNFAAWMHPARPGADPTRARVGQWQDRRVVAYHAALRSFAVTMTAMLFLIIASALVEVPTHATWSCGGSGTFWHANCSHVVRAGGVLACFAILAVVLGLSRATHIRYDAVAARGGSERPTTPLAWRLFWTAKRCVARQGVVHAVVAVAVIVWLALAPLARGAQAWWAPASFLALVAGVAVVAASTYFSMARDLGTPPEPGTAEAVVQVPEQQTVNVEAPLSVAAPQATDHPVRRAVVSFATKLAAVALAVAVAYLLAIPKPVRGADSYHLRYAVLYLLVVQAVAALAVVGCALAMVPGQVLPPSEPSDLRENSPMFRGYAAALLPFVAWLWGAFLGAVALSLMTTLTEHVADGGQGLRTPGWASFVEVGSYAIVGLVVLTVAWFASMYGFGRTAVAPHVQPRIIGAAERATPYRRALARAWAVRRAYLLAVPVVITSLAWWGCAIWQIATTARPHAANLVASVGAALLAAVPAAIVTVYRNTGKRKAVGVIWDVVTFWPRAAHPFGPPSYAERAVPQLVDRHAALTANGGRVVVSSHSQGAVIGAALLAQAGEDAIGRTAWVTYGCQLTFLYARGFPAYCGLHLLDHLAERLDARWLNLFRLTDYLGDRVRTANGQRNYEVADLVAPTSLWPQADELLAALPDEVFERDGDLVGDATALGHSDYPAAREYHRAVVRLEETLVPVRPRVVTSL